MSLDDYIKRSWNELCGNDQEKEETVPPAKKEKIKSDSRENSTSRKRSKPNAKYDTEKTSKFVKKPLVLETDPEVLQRRQKQIDYGKNTVGYQNYTQQVSIENRTKDHPKTPDKYVKYSRRSWDTLVKIWRKKLHDFDGNEDKQEDEKPSDGQADEEFEKFLNEEDSEEVSE